LLIGSDEEREILAEEDGGEEEDIPVEL